MPDQEIEIPGIPNCPFCGTAPHVFRVTGAERPSAICPNESCVISNIYMSVEEWGTRPLPPGAVIAGFVEGDVDQAVFALDGEALEHPGRYLLVPLEVKP